MLPNAKLIAFKAMHIGSRNKQFSYMMKGHKLDVVTTEKDLGVFVSSITC